jgi:hypothetical protein
MAKAKTDIRSLARSHTDAAIKTLVGIMNQPNAAPAARVSAAEALLSRGWGKATQFTELTINRSAKQLSDDELANIASGSSEGTADEAEAPQVTH